MSFNSGLRSLIGGILIGVFFRQTTINCKKNTTITVKKNTTKALEAEITGIYPGDSREYAVNLNVKDAGISDISLVFRNKENDDGKLKTIST